jgi:hypothetical protein
MIFYEFWKFKRICELYEKGKEKEKTLTGCWAETGPQADTHMGRLACCSLVLA